MQSVSRADRASGGGAGDHFTPEDVRAEADYSADYWTLSEPGTHSMRVLGSRFSGWSVPVQSEDEFQERLAAVKHTHHDASHHCYAVRIRGDRELVERSSDAGEPKGTAGQPLLREVRNRELENCGVIVSRWFGGTKLGTASLARAYGVCASFSLDAAGRVLRRSGPLVELWTPYEQQALIYQLAGKLAAPVAAAADRGGMSFRIRLRDEQLEMFHAEVRELSHGKLTAIENGRWIS